MRMKAKLGVRDAGLKNKQRVAVLGQWSWPGEDTVQPGIKVVSHQQAASFCLALTGGTKEASLLVCGCSGATCCLERRKDNSLSWPSETPDEQQIILSWVGDR